MRGAGAKTVVRGAELSRGGKLAERVRCLGGVRPSAAGTHEFNIMALLGHSTLKVTQGYAHAFDSKLREAITLVSGANVVEFQRKEA
jgi:hypothetical protein